MKKVLAVASGGGHWEQLMMLRSSLDPHDVCYATTRRDMAATHGIEPVAELLDCNQHTPIRALLCLIAAIRLVLKARPSAVISTGAAPGFFCILAGRLIGAKTLWVDSVANAEQLSMCGKLSKHVAHECLTQWDHLASDTKPLFRGSVL